MTTQGANINIAPDLLEHLHASQLGGQPASHLPAPNLELQPAPASSPAPNDDRFEFLAMILHELRNPLTQILASADLLRRNDELGEVLQRATRHVAYLADDLLELCGVGRPTFKISLQPLELGALAQTTVEAQRDAFGRKGITLTAHLSEGPVWVSGDTARLVIVLRNLLGNAAKYTADGGRVDVTLRTAGDHACLSVHDTGVGLDAAALDRVFRPFVREHRYASSTVPGYGIGLALVQTLVTLHGGTVTADSLGRGLGCEFTVRLPIIRPPHNPPVARGPVPPD